MPELIRSVQTTIEKEKFKLIALRDVNKAGLHTYISRALEDWAKNFYAARLTEDSLDAFITAVMPTKKVLMGLTFMLIDAEVVDVIRENEEVILKVRLYIESKTADVMETADTEFKISISFVEEYEISDPKPKQTAGENNEY